MQYQDRDCEFNPELFNDYNIITYRKKSITEKDLILDGFIFIDVLKWDRSKWAELCPYKLRTDGEEWASNPGGILFENFYQGLKVYPKIYPIKVYPSQYQKNNDKYLMWEYKTVSGEGDELYPSYKKYREKQEKEGMLFLEGINLEYYYRWRNSLWQCDRPIRYPNHYNHKGEVLFSLIENNKEDEKEHKREDEKEEKEENYTSYKFLMGYIDARKEVYVKEYKRLVRKTVEYKKLLSYLKEGKKLCISEIDVPDSSKRGYYGEFARGKFCGISKERLEILLEDSSEAFGHGLALCMALLEDMK